MNFVRCRLRFVGSQYGDWFMLPYVTYNLEVARRIFLKQIIDPGLEDDYE